MNILFESKNLRLENEFEATFLVNKHSGQILLDDDFYGDPKCGLIDEHERWAVVAGEHLTVWTPQQIKKFEETEPKWIHELRVNSSGQVELLTDPWGNNPAIWVLDTRTFELRKSRDFLNYQGEEHVENVAW